MSRTFKSPGYEREGRTRKNRREQEKELIHTCIMCGSGCDEDEVCDACWDQLESEH